MSSTVVFDDIDDCKEWSALHGFDRSVEAVLSSGLCIINSPGMNLLGLRGSGLLTEKRSCIGDSRAGEVADLFNWPKLLLLLDSKNGMRPVTLTGAGDGAGNKEYLLTRGDFVVGLVNLLGGIRGVRDSAASVSFAGIRSCSPPLVVGRLSSYDIRLSRVLLRRASNEDDRLAGTFLNMTLYRSKGGVGIGMSSSSFGRGGRVYVSIKESASVAVDGRDRTSSSCCSLGFSGGGTINLGLFSIGGGGQRHLRYRRRELFVG